MVNRGVMNISYPSKDNLSLAAKRTHDIRTSKTEDLIRRTILDFKKRDMKISKASIARKLGMTREQVSKRYSHLFNEPVFNLKGINVLSLFDGMSCTQIALEKANINVKNYYASEVDKHAMQITLKNYPRTQQLGCIKKVKFDALPQIDLLVGGSPCRGFSQAGKRLNFNDSRSKLFFEFVRVLKECKPKYFLLENVKMKKEYSDIISELLGVQPIEINSSLVSAQNRIRLYWTNIKNIKQPKDRGIKLIDILEHGTTDRNKSYCIDANYAKSGNLKSYFEKNRRQLIFSKNGLCHVGDADIKGFDINKRVYHTMGKSPTLPASSGSAREPKILYGEESNYKYRKLTTIECERLQTVPDNYTEGVSETQRYKMLGNGFTVDIIAHIFSKLPAAYRK